MCAGWSSRRRSRVSWTRSSSHTFTTTISTSAPWRFSARAGWLYRAAEALRLLKPRVAIPVHWGTYRRLGLARDPATLREPAEQFERLAAELAPEVEVHVLAPGERVELPLPSAAPAGGVQC